MDLPPPDVVVAVIAAVGAVAAAAVPAWLSLRRREDRWKQRIGEPNGHGSITNMLAELLHLSNGIAAETRENTRAIGHLEERTASLHADHAELRGLVIGEAPAEKRTPNGLH